MNVKAIKTLISLALFVMTFHIFNTLKSVDFKTFTFISKKKFDMKRTLTNIYSLFDYFDDAGYNNNIPILEIDWFFF